MKLKLTKQEFMALYQLLQQLNHKYVCQDMEDKLYHILLTSLFIRFHKVSIIIKPQYSIKIAEAEAIALWVCTHDNKMPESSFEGNLLNTINNSIHQRFSL